MQTAEGSVAAEHTIDLLGMAVRTGRQHRGRLDIFVSETGDYVTVVEIKATDWDKIKPGNVAKNLGAHRRQVWRYIEEYLDGDKVNVCAGVIYPREPETPGLKERVESYLNDYGLQVVWYEN